MGYLIFLGGVLLGVVLANLLRRRNTGYGYFKIVPYENGEDGFYTVNVHITPDQKLLNVTQIILRKDNSQK